VHEQLREMRADLVHPTDLEATDIDALDELVRRQLQNPHE
jgi:hypothetical protein